MVCPACNAVIEDDSVFCPECGARQGQKNTCPKCGKELEERVLFCPECGAGIGETQPANGAGISETQQSNGAPRSVPPVRRGHGGRVVAIILLVSLVIIGAAIFLYYHYFSKSRESPNASTYAEQGEGTAKKQKDNTSKDQASEADIAAVGGETCSLEGMIKTDVSGRKVIAWEDGVSISGLDENGQAVLAKDVTNVYINDIGLEDGVLDTVASNKKVVLSGQIYFIGDAIYIKSNKITDESGTVIENNKDTNSQIVKDTISYDYIIPYSSTILLSEGDISGLSLQEINYAKNEIYARHGRKFKSAELNNYFGSKSWYRGTIEPDAFTDAMISEIERKNVTYLSDVEFRINPAGYQLDSR